MRLVGIVSILLAAVACAAQYQDGCIEGKVIDTTGAPVAYVHVIGIKADQSGSSFSTRAGSDGYFRMDMAVTGEYDLSTTDELKTDSRHISSEPPIPPSAVRATALPNGKCSSAIVKQAPRARLRLKGTNLLTGDAIASVAGEVRFSGQSVWEGMQDDNGDLLVPSNAELELQVGALGYSNSEILKVSPLKPSEIRDTAVSLRPIQTGCVTGTLIDQEGRPLGGVKVQLNSIAESLRFPGGMRTTSKNGSFRFTRVQPGGYGISTNEVEGYPLFVNQEDKVPTWLLVQPTIACSDVTIRLGPKAAKLRISVIDAATGKRLKNADVWLNGEHGPNSGWSTRVIEDPMPVPALEQFAVTAGQEGYESSQPITVSPLRPEQTMKLTIELQPKAPKPQE